MFGDTFRPMTPEELAAQSGQPAPAEPATAPAEPPQLHYHREAELPPIAHDGSTGLRYWRMSPAEAELDGPAPDASQGEHPLRYGGLHRRYHGKR